MSVWSGHTATTKGPFFCCVLHLYIQIVSIISRCETFRWELQKPKNRLKFFAGAILKGRPCMKVSYFIPLKINKLPLKINLYKIKYFSCIYCVILCIVSRIGAFQKNFAPKGMLAECV